METGWGSEIELERKRRINVSIWAYGYEVENDLIVSDEMFDSECLKIRAGMDTGSVVMDGFFREEFLADSGIWIHKHPELEKLKEIYVRYYRL